MAQPQNTAQQNSVQQSSPQPRAVSGQEVLEHLTPALAVRSLHEALAAGLDPAADHARRVEALAHGQLLLMPSEFQDSVGIKTLTLAPGNPARGLPSIQGSYQLFDAATLSPRALVDGAALTAVRTPAVSVLGVDLLAPRRPLDVLLFGTGVQAREHLRVLAGVREVARVGVVGRSEQRTEALVESAHGLGLQARAVAPAEAEEAVASADVVLCCTAASEPLFDGSRVRPGAVVVAMGSHDPQARETDDALAARAQVVVEDRATALREAGDVVQAVDHGAVAEEDLVDLAAVVAGRWTPDPERPLLFKTVGMGWQDLVTARALLTALDG